MRAPIIVASVTAMTSFLAILLLAASTGADAVCELAASPRERTASFACLACHDGTVARGIGVGHGYHPVGTDYLAARTTRLSASLRIAPPPELVLVGGRVECTTCHDGASREPAATALPMRRSSLCFACHAM